MLDGAYRGSAFIGPGVDLANVVTRRYNPDELVGFVEYLIRKGERQKAMDLVETYRQSNRPELVRLLEGLVQEAETA